MSAPDNLVVRTVTVIISTAGLHSRISVHSDRDCGVWLAWTSGAATMSCYVPIAAARELAAALSEAADVSGDAALAAARGEKS